MLLNFTDLHSASNPTADICIVGSGPAGLTIAREFLGSGHAVLVLESGSDQYGQEAEQLSRFESSGESRAAPHAVRRRILGGTSSIWTGRCVPLDPIDFQARDWIEHSGWPIDHHTLAPFLARAGQILGIGPSVGHRQLWNLLHASEPRPPWNPRLLVPEVFQASLSSGGRTRAVPLPEDPDAENLEALQHGGPPSVDFADANREAIARSRNVSVALESHVLQIARADGGTRVTGVVVGGAGGRKVHVRAPLVVLACGGIDNSRLLLLSESERWKAPGNAHDNVGRYLMDHHYAPLGEFKAPVPEPLRRHLGWRRATVAAGAHMYLTGLTLAPDQQVRARLPRSTLYALESVCGPHPAASLGRAARALRERKGLAAFHPDLLNVARHPVSALAGAYRRLVLQQSALARISALTIGCNVEQFPNPDSRVTLGTSRDRFDQPLAHIHWKIDAREIEAYRLTAELFLQESSRLGFAGFEVTEWLRDRQADWRPHLHDMAHPMGSTRMAHAERHGVVDGNCQVFGVDGLFVAGSSVMPTASTANPTFTIVALALRLADHLKRRSEA